MKKDNRSYYDAFSSVYEDHRHQGYHLWLDELEFSILRPYIDGRDIFEAGCGTGLILERAARIARTAVGADLSPGMLEKAKAKGLECVEADLGSLPFPDASFDTVYSFKVLAHVRDIRPALAELSRITRPGGHLLLEFYNPTSLRGWVKRLKPPTRIDAQTDDEQVFTRFDGKTRILSYLPRDLHPVDWRGVRVITPAARVHDIPFFGRAIGELENRLSRSVIRGFGGFLIAIVRKDS